VKQIRLKYLFTGIFLAVLSVYMLYLEKEVKIEEHLTTQSKLVEQDYNLIYGYYQNLAKVIFKNHIDKEIYNKLLDEANISSSEQKKVLRDNLYSQLKSTYQTLYQNNLKQLHFHLKNNDSFLRFHRVEKFGDNLTKVRDTVKYVNDTKKQIDGFEEGRIYNGFRFVFPLFFNSKHVGSVEISFSTLAMSKEFIEKLNSAANFFIKKTIVDNKVFDDEKVNYTDSPLEDYYVEKITAELTSKKLGVKKGACFDKKLIKNLYKKIDTYDLFSLYSAKTNKILTFKKIYNPVSKKFVALFVVRSDGIYIKNKTNNFYMLSIIATILILSICWFLCRISIYREKIKNNISLIEAILDSTDNAILVIDNNREIIKYNTNFTKLWDVPHELAKKGDDTEVLGFVLDKLLEPEQFIEKVNYLYANPTKESFDYISFKDGRIIERVSKPMYIDSNVVARVWGFRDKTKEIETQNQLKELNETLEHKVEAQVKELQQKDQKMFEQAKMAQMGEMISMIAHQWRQPLGAIASSVVSVQNKLSLGKFDMQINEDREKFLNLLDQKLNNVSEYTEFLSKTIDDFRGFYKKDNHKELYDLKTLVENTLNIIQIPMENHDIKFDLQFNSLEKIYIFRNELIQVILNILKNSEDNFIEKEMDEKKVTIKTYEDKKYQIIDIEDNGGGIKEELLPKIFDPYFSTKESKNGTGLGLYMSKMIIEDHHNGKLEVQNTNNGVIFKIKILKGGK
jgi:signal transduction histidine kinase